MLAACEEIARGRVGAWRDSRPGLLALMTTLPGRPYNGLYGLDASATRKDATALARKLAASDVSWCARLRPRVPAYVDESLRQVGLVEEDATILMATPFANDAIEGSLPPELVLSMAGPEDHLAIASVLESAFGTPPSSAAKLLDPVYSRVKRIKWYLGRVDGVAVTCAMSVVAGDAAGIFAVGTQFEARRKGYGSSVTSRALRDAAAAGARYGVLTASPEVQGVYERLGFRVLERWRRLVPAH